MSEPFLAEIKMFGFNFPPRGWAFCDGQILPINQNQSLYSLLGTTYGGDGRTSFALPDLRGRAPIHVGQRASGTPAHALGSRGGEQVHTLTVAEVPEHTHTVTATTDNSDSPIPQDNLLAPFAGGYAPDDVDPATLVPLHGQTISTGGSGGGHNNMQPSMVVGFAIALQGLFPSRN